MDWDSELISKLEKLGKENNFSGYLDLLNKNLEKVRVSDSNEKMLYLPRNLKDVFFKLTDLKVDVSVDERLYLRESVVKKLQKAQSDLPIGLHLLITDAYRSEALVWKLYHKYFQKLKEREPSLTDKETDLKLRNILAMPDDVVPPGHMTGGAVDVVLADSEGNEIPLKVSDEEIPREKQGFLDCPGLPKEISESRQILYRVMTEAGFNNYFREFWHYSYGDPYWAVRRTEKVAIYGVPVKELFEQE